MKTSLFALPTLTLALLLNGCYAPGSADPDRLPDSRYPQIVTYGNLVNQFFFNQPIVTPEKDGVPMSVSVNLRLKEGYTSKEVPCQYRFIFLDARGTPLDADPAWQYRNFPPRINVNLQGFAPDTGAVDWLLEVRRDRVERKPGRY